MSVSIKIHGIQKRPLQLDKSFIDGIKQKLFLFDSIGIPNTGELFDILLQIDRHAFDDLLAMQKEKAIFDTATTNAYELKQTPEGELFSVPRPGMIIGVDFLLENPGIGEEYGELMKISHETSTPNAIKYEAEARISSILWNGLYSEEKVDEFIPILSMSYLPQIAKPKIDVYNVIFENIPIPHPETPIEHILEFRSNKDNEGRLLAFRSLVNKLGREDYTEIEIKQEIEHLMHQYKESLKKHNVKFVIGILETAVAFAFSKAFLLAKVLNGVLKFKSTQANLLSSEISAPGRAISYLYNAQSMFGKR